MATDRDVNRYFPRVYLIDGDDTTRHGLARILASDGIMVSAFADGARFLKEFDASACGVVLLDIDAGDVHAMELLTMLAAMNTTQPVIVLAGQGNVALCRRAFKTGASDFLEKPVYREVLLDVVHQCIKDHVMLHARQRAAGKARQCYALLSARERQVLGLVVAGLTNREIGRALALSPRTVEVHRAHVCEKLETESLADLVRRYAPLVEGDDI